MSEQKNEEGVFWLSRKFWYTVLAAAVFTTFALTGTVTFTSEQVMTFVLGLTGLAIGGHTITDVMSQFANRPAVSGVEISSIATTLKPEEPEDEDYQD